MHLVTGAIIAALAGRARQNKVLQGLPRFRTGPLQIAHALPGRIRFIIPSLRQQHEQMKGGLEQLRTLRGVKSVDSSPVTGSLMVRFDDNLLPPPLLFSAVARLLGLEHQLAQPITSEVIRELRALGGSLNRMVYDESYGMLDLRTLTIAGLVVLGGRKLLVERWTSVPTGLTLLWWAFNQLNRGEGSTS